ncbi:MAG: aldehyde dehydrogenase [Phenylobacterium sp.]|nr:aldehyde dehydrogenase [Phenylobacterium sp.]
MTIPYTKIEGLYIGAKWVPPQSGEREAVINPANEEVIGQAPVGGAVEAEAAIAAARQAFDSGVWSEKPQEERTEIMRRMHTALHARAAQIKALMIAEGGVTRMLAESMHFDAPMVLVDRLLARSLIPTTRHLPLETAANPFNPAGQALIGSGVVVREPIGVVTAISPYNAAFLVNISKVFPALLAGNTVILKPSPFTPFSALLFGEVADEIGLPPGVLNVVTGGAEVGSMLTSDPRVDMVTFTGSEAVGAAIMGQGAPTLKKVLLELGGKSALIVREDADVQKAAMEGLFQISNHCGQGCALATRHLVHNSIRPAYIETMKAMVGQLALGDPAELTTVVGPLIRGGARDRVERMVAAGQAEGAKLVFGGSRPEHLPKGFFYNVTVFDDVDNAMSIAQDEIFGPVAAVIGFDSDEEAVKIANHSRYGLYGGIHSRDPAKAYAMALKLRTGGVILNGGLYKQNDAPFGGYKRSGLGREYGDQWMNEYTQEKTIVFPIGV